MIRSCITISLVPEAKGGPFVFWNDLPQSIAKTAEAGFDAVEIFAPSPKALESAGLQELLSPHRLKLAALGTGAGWVLQKLHLCHADSAIRARARKFIADMIDVAGPLGASVIIGSMQGRWENGISREQALDWLAQALDELAIRAAAHRVPLFYEPLNRYETNLFNRLDDTVGFLQSLKTQNIKILADLFHMNIEEVSMPAAIRAAGAALGHVHFVDSNRRHAGAGHIDFGPIATALHEIGYAGYLSAEALPHPTPEEAANQTMRSFTRYFRNSGTAE